MNGYLEKPRYVSTRAEAFVTSIIKGISKDKQMAAVLKRADNMATEYQSWEYLAKFNIALDKDYERLPYATIAAAIAKAKIAANGTLSVGEAIANTYRDDGGNESDQAKAKLRRLLACDTTKEVCRVLRALFSLIQGRGVINNLDFVKLLEELLKFHWHEKKQYVKSRWAENFYRLSRDEIAS